MVQQAAAVDGHGDGNHITKVTGVGYLVAGKRLSVLDAMGQETGEIDVYRGRVMNSLHVLAAHPQQREILAYFFTEKTLCWVDPTQLAK